MKIKCCAILHNDIIYKGRSHAEIGWEMLDTGACKIPFPGGIYQGFVTEGGNYVGRMLAWKIALEAGQFERKDSCNPRIGLFSEDLIHSKIYDYPLKNKRYTRIND
jgi:hypothetical protein